MRTKLWRTISAIKSEVRCQLLLSVFNTKSLQCDSDWFNVIQTDSMWFSRFSMTQQIQYDSMDSEWISLIRNDSVWLNVILAACGESRVRQCSRTSLHMQTSALIKCWGKAWFDFSDFFAATRRVKEAAQAVSVAKASNIFSNKDCISEK